MRKSHVPRRVVKYSNDDTSVHLIQLEMLSMYQHFKLDQQVFIETQLHGSPESDFCDSDKPEMGIVSISMIMTRHTDIFEVTIT